MGILKWVNNLEQILKEILKELKEINLKLESIDNHVHEIKGTGLYDSVSDVCEKLDEICSSVDNIDS